MNFLSRHRKILWRQRGTFPGIDKILLNFQTFRAGEIESVVTDIASEQNPELMALALEYRNKYISQKSLDRASTNKLKRALQNL